MDFVNIEYNFLVEITSKHFQDHQTCFTYKYGKFTTLTLILKIE